MATTLSPRAITDAEAPWVEAVRDDGPEAVQLLYERLEVMGVPWTTQAAIGRFVADLADGRLPDVAAPTKSAWRKVLRLAGPPGSPMPEVNVARSIPGLLRETWEPFSDCG